MTLSFVVCVTLAFVVGLILGAVFHAWLTNEWEQASKKAVAAILKELGVKPAPTPPPPSPPAA